MAASKKRKKTSGGKAAKPARAKQAAKPARAKQAAKKRPKQSRRPAAAPSAETDLVYSDIRRSMHGAILRNLR